MDDSERELRGYKERYGFLDAIDFKRAWAEARMLDSTLSPNPPQTSP